MNRINVLMSVILFRYFQRSLLSVVNNAMLILLAVAVVLNLVVPLNLRRKDKNSNLNVFSKISVGNILSTVMINLKSVSLFVKSK